MTTDILGNAKRRPVNAYLGLIKARGILPHLITAGAAMFVAAPHFPSAGTFVFTLVGGAFVAAGANSFNCYLDRDIDAMMSRTRLRPLVTGQIAPTRALGLGAALGLVGAAILMALVGWLPAVLSVIALVYYVIPYTLWLKRRTYLSAVVGSGAGAIPPLVGWAAVTGRLDPTAFLLAGIIVLWTLPHFWALASFRRGDYLRAGIRVLPEKGATVLIVASSFMLVAATLLLKTAAHLGPLYLGFACLLGAGLLALAVRVAQKESFKRAWTLYRFSILYIALLFGMMIIDRIVF